MTESNSPGIHSTPEPHAFQPLPLTIYTGIFIHCPSLNQLSINKGYVCVNEHGRIAYTDLTKIDEGYVPSQSNYGKEENDVSLDVEAITRKVGWEEKRNEVKVLIAGGKEGHGFWFPGFVDTHIHASQTPNASFFGRTTLLSWLERYTFPLESLLNSPDHASSVYTTCIRQTLSHGTTTAAYYATICAPSTNMLAALCLRYGQRAFVGRCNMDTNLSPEYYRDISSEEALNSTKSTIAYCDAIDPHSELITPIITPRFAPSCTHSLLSELGSLSNPSASHPNGLPIQTHLSENLDEISLVNSMFPDSPDYTSVYAFHNLLTQRTVLAHSIHLSPSEIRLIKKHDSGISHCPVSNSALGSGLCHVRSLLDAGVKVGLGTDVSGGYSMSILEAVRQSVLVSRLVGFLASQKETSTRELEIQSFKEESQGDIDINGEPNGSKIDADDSGSQHPSSCTHPKLSVSECLYLATLGGASVLNLSDKIGSFETGKCFDAQYISLAPSPSPIPNPSPPKKEDETFFPDPTVKIKDLDITKESNGEAGESLRVAGRGNVRLFWDRETWHERIEKWVFTGDDRNTVGVFVRGRCVLRKKGWELEEEVL
ncbi:MAG: hypothetical protein M1834_001088 [Cirrosporium novae-zelandiae]|nr:MAG: hypothetical protein M1834_001088 [Cirrosporium novae-zelandiae]